MKRFQRVIALLQMACYSTVLAESLDRALDPKSQHACSSPVLTRVKRRTYPACKDDHVEVVQLLLKACADMDSALEDSC